MVNLNSNFGPAFIFLLLSLLLQLHPGIGKSELQLNYYKESCPRAEEIIKEQVKELYNKHANTVISWLRNLFHDCFVEGCDASLLLDTKNGVVSERAASRSFGLKNLKYINTIKKALEKKCPKTVSCADIVALSAKEGALLLGGPNIEMKTGRRDSTKSYFSLVDDSLPNHNDSVISVLSTFRNIGINTEQTVALLGAHSVGRTHCVNLVNRLYPEVDPTLNPDKAKYLKRRCPDKNPNSKAVEYSRNDLETPMVLDNMYYKNILDNKGLLVIDQELAYDENTLPFVTRMADDNEYFHEQFAKAMSILSENNPLTGDEGEIRENCRVVNR